MSTLHSSILRLHPSSLFFFFNDTATTEIYTLSLHDALPILESVGFCGIPARVITMFLTVSYSPADLGRVRFRDRKSTRLNSSHGYISYAVFCLKKKKQRNMIPTSSPQSVAHSVLAVYAAVLS